MKRTQTFIQVEDLGSLDVTNLDDKTRLALGHFLIRNKKKQVFFPDEQCKILVNNILYQFSLSHIIFHRIRMKNPSEDRFEIISSGQPLGKGREGIVHSLVGTLCPPASGLPGPVTFKNKKQRLVKIITIRKSFSEENIHRQFEQAKNATHLHLKTPVVLNETSPPATLHVMRKFNGTTLYDFIEKNMLPDLEKRIQLIINILLALKEQVHDKQLIHRDIKPENILVDSQTLEVNFIDYGFCFKKGTTPVLPYCGTIGYTPLDQFQGRDINEKADVYALGRTISWLIYLRPIKSDNYMADAQKDTQFELSLPMEGLKERRDFLAASNTIKRMTLANQKERCSLEDALQSFKNIGNDLPPISYEDELALLSSASSDALSCLNTSHEEQKIHLVSERAVTLNKVMQALFIPDESSVSHTPLTTLQNHIKKILKEYLDRILKQQKDELAISRAYQNQFVALMKKLPLINLLLETTNKLTDQTLSKQLSRIMDCIAKLEMGLFCREELQANIMEAIRTYKETHEQHIRETDTPTLAKR